MCGRGISVTRAARFSNVSASKRHTAANERKPDRLIRPCAGPRRRTQPAACSWQVWPHARSFRDALAAWDPARSFRETPPAWGHAHCFRETLLVQAHPRSFPAAPPLADGDDARADRAEL